MKILDLHGSKEFSATHHVYKTLADEGYIFVFQDIRGKFGSEGVFVMQRPAHGWARVSHFAALLWPFRLRLQP